MRTKRCAVGGGTAGVLGRRGTSPSAQKRTLLSPRLRRQFGDMTSWEALDADLAALPAESVGDRLT